MRENDRYENPKTNPDLTRQDVIKIAGMSGRLAGLNLQDLDLSSISLAGCDLSRSKLMKSKLSRTDLSHATLVETDLTGADLEETVLDYANLSHATLRQVDLLKISKSKWNVPRLEGTNLSGVDLSNMVLGLGHYRSLSMHGVLLDSAILDNASLIYCSFWPSANFRDYHEIEPVAYGFVKEKRGIRNNPTFSVLSQVSAIESDLSKTSFRRVILVNVNFTRAIFEEAQLEGSNLSKVILNGAHMRAASFTPLDDLMYGAKRTVLKEAVFSGADLRDTDWRGADLKGVDFTGADLTGAIFGEFRYKEGLYLTGEKIDPLYRERTDLTGAKITDRQLKSAIIQKGTIMPNGKIYE